MVCRKRCGKVNIKLVVILLLVVVAVGVSLVIARQTRRSALSARALAAGQAAFAKEDWPAAVKSFREYLGRNPDDVGVLRQYAEACLAVRPLDAASVSGAISGYRRVLELVPGDDAVGEKLATLYSLVGNFDELASLARTRLEQDPEDVKAPLWLAEALARMGRKADARQTLQSFIDRLQPLPARHPEYVRACVQMSRLAASDAPAQPQATANDANTPAGPTPLDWLNRAADYSPDSAEVLISRAQFYRRMAAMPVTSEQDRAAFLERARKDLQAADAKATDDPRLRFLLGAEWLAHGRRDRAAAQMQALDALPPETLKEHFFDINDWKVSRFLFAAELTAGSSVTPEVVSLADETLESLTEPRHRAQVLPSAIPLYTARGRTVDARRCLDEYLGLVQDQGAQAESPLKLAGLKALVAGAEDKPYAVIDALEPVIATDNVNPALWRLLAQAYDRTGQTGRAVKALARYHQLSPRDPQALHELARQYAKAGNWQKAFDTAVAAKSLGSTDLMLDLLRIRVAVNLAAAHAGDARAERLAPLSAELAALQKANPTEVEIRLLQAAIANALDRPDEAQRILEQAVEQCSEPLKAQIQLAGHYLRTQRMDEAIGTCEAACKSHGDTAEPWAALADIHAAKADYDSARRCLTEGLATVAGVAEKRSLSIRLALLDLVHGDRAAGIRRLQDVAEQDPQEIQARTLLLGVREIQQDRAAAQGLVDELRRAEGESGLRWRLHQASLWLSAEDGSAKRPEIVKLLRHCIDADPAWSAPVLLLSAVHERAGEFTKIEDLCRQCLSSNPAAADVAGRLLTLFERQGRFADAQRLLQQVQISPQAASAWQVRVALGEKDFSRAIDELKLRVSNDEKDASSRIQLARLLYEQTGDADQALEYLRQAQAISGEARALVAVKASILRGEGKTAEAQRVLDEYVATHDDFDAYWMRAVYFTEQGDRDRAEQDYRKLTTFPETGAAGYELLGNFYAGTDRLDQAVATLEEGLGAFPEDLRLQRGLMRLLLLRARGRDREKALGLLTALEEKMPLDAELVTVRAAQMLREPNVPSFEPIQARLESLVKMSPTAVDAHQMLVAIAMRRADYQGACDYAARALEANPNHPSLLVARARAELALGYAPMAVRLARQALGQDPNNLEALGVFVDGALADQEPGGLQEARTLLGAALARRPDNAGLLILQSHVLNALGMPADAIPALQAYCQSAAGKENLAALVMLADLYRLADDPEKAHQWLLRAEQVDARSQAVVHARFMWRVSQKRFDELGQVSSEYIGARNQNPATVVRAAETLLALGPAPLKQEAVTLFRHAVTLAPASLSARRGLASALYQTGRPDSAKEIYRQLLAEHPDNVRVLNDMAWILQEQDRKYGEALELADKGLRLARETPDRMHLLDTRGTILSNLPDRLKDAQKDFEELVRLAASDPQRLAEARAKLARIRNQLDSE